ncbi:MAG TPA: carbohydrate ABC transporter permease [Bacillales bacterium]|nr:carbohydrate ABC transporter permease [Bacillales bacterium]
MAKPEIDHKTYTVKTPLKAKLLRPRGSELIPPLYLWIGLIILAVFTLLPFLYLISSSLSQTRELLEGHLFPRHLTFENYKHLFTGSGASHFLLAIRNSTIVAVCTTAFTLILSVFAAYAFSKVNFPFRSTALFAVLAMQLLPSISIIAPLYVMMRDGVALDIPFTGIVFWRTPPLLDSDVALILAYTTFALPFAIWVLTGYFQTIPKALEEAAYIDGCSRIRALFRIVLPLAIPGIAATAILTLLLAWDEFIFANAFTQTYASKTLPIAIQEFIGKHSIDWGLMTAGGFVASLPPVIISLFLYRYIVAGLSGGLKE